MAVFRPLHSISVILHRWKVDNERGEPRVQLKRVYNTDHSVCTDCVGTSLLFSGHIHTTTLRRVAKKSPADHKSKGCQSVDHHMTGCTTLIMRLQNQNQLQQGILVCLETATTIRDRRIPQNKGTIVLSWSYN